MTTALCFNCGKMKFGAFCPCGECGAGATGDNNLNILFCDHQIPVETLERFGGIIQEIHRHSDKPEVQFWAFMTYVSNHPSKLLACEAPPEFAEEVNALMKKMDLPIIEVSLKPQPKNLGPPVEQIELPSSIFNAYTKVNDFSIIDTVQIKTKDGKIYGANLLYEGSVSQLIIPVEYELKVDDIAAIRKAPGCLFGWLIKPKWIEDIRK